MRQQMDVDRIRQAVRRRFDELEGRDPELTLAQIADRMGASARTVTNLMGTRPKTSFERKILRSASRALEWPEDALERIEAGEVDPDDLEDFAWEDAEEARMRRVEQEQSRLAGEIDEIRSDIVDLRRLVAEALGLDGSSAE